MELNIPLMNGLALRIADEPAGEAPYPTRRLQKGLLLFARGEDLAEEGVGFGVPVLKRGVQTIFPGTMKLAWEDDGAERQVTAVFGMDLVERLAGAEGVPVQSGALYAVKDSLAALHRRSPALRGLLTATSNTVRRALRWETTFEAIEPVGHVIVRFTVRGAEGVVDVAVDLRGLRKDGLTEVVVMNEQGARRFDRYRDADGVALDGHLIGAWHEVRAAEARFVDTGDGVAFSLRQAPGARLFRGRELIGTRLAWSGFGYSLPPSLEGFAYDVRAEVAR